MFVVSKQNGSGTKYREPYIFQNSKDSESWQQFLTNEAPEKNQKRFEPVSMVEMVCIPKNHELFTYGRYHTENQPHLHSAHCGQSTCVYVLKLYTNAFRSTSSIDQ